MSWKEWAVNLYEQCQDAEKRYPGLALDLVQLYPVRRLDKRELKSLLDRHLGRPPDVEFEFLEDDLITRFYGNLGGYGEFQRLGQEMYAWLRATDPSLPANRSYYGWLMMLHEMTKHCPAVGFELATYPITLSIDAVSDPLVMDFSDDFAILYGVARYKHSPFAVSMSALQMFIEPYQTRFLRSLLLLRASCAVAAEMRLREPAHRSTGADNDRSERTEECHGRH